MLVKQIGGTVIGSFTTHNQGDEIFTPSYCEVSIVKADGSEDALTWQGTDPGDGRLVLKGEGSFEFYYPLSTAPGMWYINVRWSIDYAGEAIWCTLDEPVPMQVNQTISGWVDK